MLFSIIIPTYNRASLIIDTINSVLKQRNSNFEVIVVDDGSTDNTREVISKISDKRLKYYKKKNEERGAARNFGADRANGRYLYFLDSDDILYENHLSEAESFIKNKNPKIFFQQYEIVSINGKKKMPYIPKGKIINDELVLLGNFISCHGVFIEKNVFLQNKFNEDRNLAGSEDYELWLRLSARYPILYLQKVTSALIEHDERSVLNMNKKKIINRKQLMIDYIFNDETFKLNYGKFESIIKSNSYAYISLHCFLSKNFKCGMTYLLRTIKVNPKFLIDLRFFAILKNLFLTYLNSK